MIETINKMNRISRQHLQEFGFEPDASILAAKMEIPEDKIRKIMKIAKEPISMETPIGDDDDSHLGDLIEDTGNTAPIEAAMQAGLRDVVDSSGHHPRHRRSGAHDPHPGAHDRDHQQADAHLARARPGTGSRAAGGGDRAADGHAGFESAQDHEDRAGADFPRDADR
jgi:hypothetical protein